MTTPTVPSAPVLGHVEGVQLLAAGSWPALTGPVTFTADDLANAVAALECPAVRRPVLKLGHDGKHGVGEPALGYVANLRLADEGQTAIGDYRGMPGWLTTVDDNGQSVLASAYPDRSIEGEFGYRCTLGHEHPFVIQAVALLGVEQPAVGTLESLQELYGVVAAATTPSTGGRLVVVLASARQETAVPQQINAAATTDDVRRAYYAGAGSDWDLWIGEMYVDPLELIVHNDADGSILRVPYTVAANGDVTFAEPQKVKVTYVAARAAGDTGRVVFASRTESRPGERPAASTTTPEPSTATAAEPAAASGTTDPETEGAMPDLSEGLRQRLGLAAEATEDTILAALDEALTERAETTPVAASTPPAAPTGVEQIDAVTLDELRRQAAAGAAARTQQELEHRTRTVDAAIRDGRIPPARRDHWLTQLAADPGAETVLVSLAKGTVPLTEVGIDTAPDEAEDTEFDSIFTRPVAQEA